MNRQKRSQRKSPQLKNAQHKVAAHKRPLTTKSRIPGPQAARILQRYIEGQNIRSISRDEGRDRGTIRRIVKTEEMHMHVQQMREQYFGLAEMAMEGIRRALAQSTDGRLAHEILKNVGAVPTNGDIAAIQNQMQQVGPVTEEQQVKAEMLKLVTVAYERAEMFGQAKPSIADLRVPKQIAGDSKER